MATTTYFGPGVGKHVVVVVNDDDDDGWVCVYLVADRSSRSASCLPSFLSCFQRDDNQVLCRPFQGPSKSQMVVLFAKVVSPLFIGHLGPIRCQRRDLFGFY